MNKLNNKPNWDSLKIESRLTAGVVGAGGCRDGARMKNTHRRGQQSGDCSGGGRRGYKGDRW